MSLLVSNFPRSSDSSSRMMMMMMMMVGLLLQVSSPGGVRASASLDCVLAEQGCLQEHSCMILYRLLEYCAAEEAVVPLRADARLECLEAQSALQRHRPLQVCKCQRGSRREEPCLRVYWTVRFAAYDEYEVSPYEELEVNVVRSLEVSRMGSIVADGHNQCLKAAQDCGLYEKCGSLRSEYVVACTKRAAASDGACNRQKCHKALRRFLERVPEEYSLALLFCPCSDTLCGERRRKTIVPSCSYEENVRGEDRGARPNCLSLQNFCTRDELCRSRLADFQQKCQPSPLSPSGCVRASRATCLRAYSGLIGTIMTPNYVSNSSSEVSQWCWCEGSGNQFQACQQLLAMFTNNQCLRGAISSMGVSATPPVENTAVPASVPPPRLHQDRVERPPELHSVGGSDEEEDDVSEDFLPPYSDKDSAPQSSDRGGQRGAASRAAPPLLLLSLLFSVRGACWSY